MFHFQQGNHIGTIVEVDVGDRRECWGQYLRIRVTVDISRPLKRIVRLCLREGEDPEILLLQYERLPSFCFRCGILGHQLRECLEITILSDDGKEELRYGAWMIAPTGANKQRGSGRQEETGERVRNSHAHPVTISDNQPQNDHGVEKEATAHNYLNACEKEAFSKGSSGIEEDGLKDNILALLHKLRRPDSKRS